MQFPTMLEGSRIRIYPLDISHAEQLFACGSRQEIWTYLAVKLETLPDMVQLIEKALQSKQLGLEYPFVVFDKELNRLVGSTRFLNINIPHRNLEIGWTWYSPEVWRTRVNTECKYELLKYGFEEMQLTRVQLKADSRNERSNRAIERIGAIKEGVLRQDRILPDGFKRNANLYSIIDTEWPDVKKKLESYLNL